MSKKILITSLFAALIGVLTFGNVNRALAQTTNPDPSRPGGLGQGGPAQIAGTGAFSTGAPAGNYNQGANLPPAGDLSDEEAEALLYMREEEKLAQDVYAAMYDLWGLPIFQNISQSEQNHTLAIKTLIDRYGLSDPASNLAGDFTNAGLQDLYDELVARGEESLSEALEVGVEIEEIDIRDLQESLTQTDNADIQQVYNNLLQASNNHLRSFTTTLNAKTGVTFQSQSPAAQAYQTAARVGQPAGAPSQGAGQGANVGGAWQGGSDGGAGLDGSGGGLGQTPGGAGAGLGGNGRGLRQP